jgi:hypothetical protein
MTIAPCPKCHESVRIPPTASPQASVRCPLCLDEFLLAEAYQSLPPFLEVIEDPEKGAASAESVVTTGDFGLASPDADDLPELAPAFSIDRSREVSAVSSAPSTNRRRGPVRPQRKKKNPAVEVVKIVLGGIAGLVIAQLLLWWMPWQNLRRDPFGLGPSIAGYAPWLVPARFRGDLGTDASAVGADSAADHQFDAANTADLSASGLPQRDFGDLDDLDQAPPSGKVKSKPATDKKRPDDLPLVAAEEDAVDLTPDPLALVTELPPSVDTADLGDDLFEVHPPMELSDDLETDPILEIDPEPVPADLESGSSPKPRPAAVDNVRRLTSVPPFRPADLTAALTEVQPTFEALSSADTDEALDLIKQTYANLTALAEIAAGGEELDQSDRRLAASLLLSLVEKPDGVISWLGRAGTTWLRATDRRSNNGILLVCEVQSVQAEDDLYRTELLLSDGKAIASYSDTDPAEFFQPGEQVLLMGVVVDQPADHLSGYTGQEPSVIWGPFFRVVPK